MKRIIIALTGASGAIYGVRALELLRDLPDMETHAIITPAAHRTIPHETPYDLQQVHELADASTARVTEVRPSRRARSSPPGCWWRRARSRP